MIYVKLAVPWNTLLERLYGAQLHPGVVLDPPIIEKAKTYPVGERISIRRSKESGMGSLLPLVEFVAPEPTKGLTMIVGKMDIEILTLTSLMLHCGISQGVWMAIVDKVLDGLPRDSASVKDY